MCACRIWMKECMDLCVVFSPRSSEVHAPTITAQSQYNMQVFLQLPNGQTIPVQIPANSAGGLQVVPPSVMTSRVEQQPVVNAPIQHQTVILPAQTTSPAQSQSNITKQVNPIATTVLLSVNQHNMKTWKVSACSGNITWKHGSSFFDFTGCLTFLSLF